MAVEKDSIAALPRNGQSLAYCKYDQVLAFSCALRLSLLEQSAINSFQRNRSERKRQPRLPQAVDKVPIAALLQKSSNPSVQEVRVGLELFLRLALKPFSTACQIDFVSTLRQPGLPFLSGYWERSGRCAQ